MAVGADDGEFVQFDRPSFRRSISERIEVMDVRKLFSKLSVCGPEIKAAARHLASQDAFILSERSFDLLFRCICFTPAV
ncbi:hypothetical protein [Bradyrhizobium sp. Ai1a-2]|uniref:hypothetical protein n=1 Tax=Bradyrhizobium sp. Ai1a-2 TaxID=196490 RepID=UPI001FCAA09A|nr:hypothetical protein [Bradyrhizobium sp. Ai1a-2]